MFWTFLFGGADHRNPQYVLWKFGLFPYQEDIVLGALGGDISRDEIVSGLTISDLKHKFGSVQTCDDSCEYHKYYCKPEVLKQWKLESSEFYWIGKCSPWVVMMKNGYAVNLTLIKG